MLRRMPSRPGVQMTQERHVRMFRNGRNQALRHLLDTNIMSHLMRSPAGGVGRRIAEGGEDSICTSIIVAAELRCGAAQLIEQTGATTLAPHLREWRAELAAALVGRSMGVDSTIDVTLAVRNVQEEATP